IEHYKNYAQTDYDQHGLWRFRLTAAEYTQDFTGLKKAHISQLLNLSRLQSQSVTLARGQFSTPQSKINFARGTFARGDIILFNAHGCISQHCFTSKELRIRRRDLRLSARHILLNDKASGRRQTKINYQTYLSANSAK
ncbi:MAG: hypothetical protein ACRCYV_12290, partial [Aeromonas sp.]